MDEIPKNLPLNPDYMICYTPGKVGSTTILGAMRSVGIPTHRCYDHNIQQYHRKDYPTITAVRDPIAWVVSTSLEKAMNRGTPIEIDDAKELVVSIQEGYWRNQLQYYCNWMGDQYRQITGVNIYGGRWIKRDGWAIYSIRSLIVRTDMMDTALADGLREFIPSYYPDKDLSTLKVEHKAKGGERFEGYDEFMDALKFDPRWLDKFYNSAEMCRYFFYVKELREWVKKWAKL